MTAGTASTCSKCGGEVDTEARQCMRCGARQRVEISFDDEPAQITAPARVLEPRQAAPIEESAHDPAPSQPAGERDLPPLVPNARISEQPSMLDRVSTGAGFTFRLLFVALVVGVAIVGFANGSIIVGLLALAYAIYLLLGGRWIIY